MFNIKRKTEINDFRKLSKVLPSHKLYRQVFYSNKNLENKQFSLDGYLSLDI